MGRWAVQKGVQGASSSSSGARRWRRVPPERLVGRNSFDEVKACHSHASTLIESVGIFSLNSRIQMHLLATFLCGLFFEPKKRLGTMAL